MNTDDSYACEECGVAFSSLREVIIHTRNSSCHKGSKLTLATFQEAEAALLADPTKKVVYLVRHGKSEFNRAQKIKGEVYDPYIFDAPLTDLGKAQAVEAGRALKLKVPTIDLAATSPLTRAIETCISVLSGYGQQGVPITVVPDATEFAYMSCDFGSCPSVLQEKFPEFDFSGVPEYWWYGPDKVLGSVDAARNTFKEHSYHEPFESCAKRVERLIEWFKTRQERRIVLTCHRDIIFLLTGKCFENGEANPIVI